MTSDVICPEHGKQCSGSTCCCADLHVTRNPGEAPMSDHKEPKRDREDERGVSTLPSVEMTCGDCWAMRTYAPGIAGGHCGKHATPEEKQDARNAIAVLAASQKPLGEILSQIVPKRRSKTP